MLAPAPRGRIIALDVLSILPNSPLSAQWMIAVKTTRFDDGHVIAWHIQQDDAGRCWPTKVRLDPSLLYADESSKSMHAMGIGYRWSLSLGPKPLCLDDLELICLRSSMPDMELGEDHGSWCLDILFKLERLQALVKGQALQLETWLGLPHGMTASNAGVAALEPAVQVSHVLRHSKELRSASDPTMHQTIACWPPPERPMTPEARSVGTFGHNQTAQLSWSPIALPTSSLMV